MQLRKNVISARKQTYEVITTTQNTRVFGHSGTYARTLVLISALKENYLISDKLFRPFVLRQL